MSDKSKKEPKATAAETLAAAQKARAKDAAEVARLEAALENEPSPDRWHGLQNAKANHSYSSRVCDIAQAAFDAAVRAEQDRIAAAVEAKRVADLKVVREKMLALEAEAVTAATTLTAALGRDFDLRIAAQGLNDSGASNLAWAVRSALQDGLIAVGLHPNAIQIVLN